jgi:hypothetical protein
LIRKTWFGAEERLVRKNGLQEGPNCCFWIEKSDVLKAVIRILVPKLHLDNGLLLEVGGARLFISLGGPLQETPLSREAFTFPFSSTRSECDEKVCRDSNSCPINRVPEPEFLSSGASATHGR